MKKIAVIFTGGTISMKVDPRLAAAIPALSNEQIMSMVTNIDRIAETEIVDFSHIPGPHMTPEKLMALSNLVKKMLSRPDIHGAVITHGTDTLEETAFLLDLNVITPKPVVMVAAMRNSSELGYDGPSNIAAAVATAASDRARNKGCLVVMNNEVNAASEVTKSHTLSLDTFKSMEFGPLGIIDNDEVIFYREMTRHEHIDVDHLEKRVGLVKTTLGMDRDLIDFMIDSGYQGIVLEALGRGNVPPAMLPGIERALSLGIPLVLVSRCPMGRVLGTYGYEGGGKNLKDRGVIFGGNLNGQKARIKLMLALAKTRDPQALKKIFEIHDYQ
ncbi:MAG: L-asparaginase [delta proteobacterium ML8_F1]|nr:MAG: L-asparaginase [delta proteobacterium ML8_F1]